MDETAREQSNVLQNDSSKHRTEDKVTHPKSLQDSSIQQAPVISSTEEPLNHDEREEHSDKERCENEQLQRPQQPQSRNDLISELQSLDWDALQSKFNSSMQERDEEEKKIIERFDKLVASMKIWAEAGLAMEEDRAKKRLRTRITYVQHSESKLEEKKKHYLSVVSAFQSALALLKEP